MRRGIVMAEGRRGLVVLTPEGEFVEVPGRPGATVGEEIGFDGPTRRLSVWRRRFLLAASAAACLLLVAIGLVRLPVFDGPRVAAYVAIDINPSVEIGVDRQRAVVELRALNADGERVVEGIDYRRRPVGEVAAEIIRNAEAAEYLRDGGEVFVTSMTAADVDGRFEDELVREIDQAVRSAALLAGGEPGQDGNGETAGASGTGTSGPSGTDAGQSDSGTSGRAGPGTAGQTGSAAGSGAPGPSGPGAAGQPGGESGTSGPAGVDGSKGIAASGREPSAASGRNIAVTIVRAPGELRETALASGVSPGKMAVYLLAEKHGLPVSLEDLKNGSIRQAVEPYGGIAGVLGEGRSDEERKRELAEQLAKEAAGKAKGKSAQGKSADAGMDKKAAGDGGKKVSADSGKKTPADNGKKARADSDRKASSDSGKKASADIGKSSPPNGQKASADIGKSSSSNGQKASAANGKPHSGSGGQGPSAHPGKNAPDIAGDPRWSSWTDGPSWMRQNLLEPAREDPRAERKDDRERQTREQSQPKQNQQAKDGPKEQNGRREQDKRQESRERGGPGGQQDQNKQMGRQSPGDAQERMRERERQGPKQQDAYGKNQTYGQTRHQEPEKNNRQGQSYQPVHSKNQEKKTQERPGQQEQQKREPSGRQEQQKREQPGHRSR